MNGKLFLCAAAGLLLCCTGCQDTFNTVGNESENAAVNDVRDVRVITDKFLRDRLIIRSVKMAPAASGNMSAEVAATNTRTGVGSQVWSGITGENPYTVAYKFIWKDRSGMTVETNLSVWRTVRIHPGETVFFKSVAPNANCCDFLLELKEAD